MDFKFIVKTEKNKDYYKKLKEQIDIEYETYTCFPPKNKIFNSLNLTTYDNVKVVILGQDPYHDVNQANGLAFSVNKGIKIPPSLLNIYKEANQDVSIAIPNHGDLTSWAKQGVLLLNNVLTVRAHTPNSHKGKGWEAFTLNVIKELNKREKPMVFILWGSNAKEKEIFIDKTRHLVLKSVHPSPLSANRGFFGSKPFSKANDFLMKNNIEPINWQID